MHVFYDHDFSHTVYHCKQLLLARKIEKAFAVREIRRPNCIKPFAVHTRIHDLPIQLIDLAGKIDLVIFI